MSEILRQACSWEIKNSPDSVWLKDSPTALTHSLRTAQHSRLLLLTLPSSHLLYLWSDLHYNSVLSQAPTSPPPISLAVRAEHRRALHLVELCDSHLEMFLNKGTHIFIVYWTLVLLIGVALIYLLHS